MPDFHSSPRGMPPLGAIAAVGACAFAVNTAFVVTGHATLADLWVLEHLREPNSPGHPTGPDGLVTLAIAASTGASPLLAGPAVAILALALNARRRAREAVLLAATGTGAVALGLFLKTMFARERPNVAWRIAQADGASYPSTQTLFATALALSLALVVYRSTTRPGARALALAIALLAACLVGASRIHLGVHWASDVVAAWSAGAAWAGFCGLATTGQRTRQSSM